MFPVPLIQVVRTMRMAPEPALDNSLDIHFLQLKQQQQKNTQHNKQKTNERKNKQTNKVVRTTRMAPEPALDDSS